MSTTTFLFNEALWNRLEQVKRAKHTDAAIAYFGDNGAALLLMKAGDRLVVDLSEATVRAGGTDPYEIDKLMRKGVHVFNRKYLHAKTILVDRWLIVGSAN